MPTANVNGVSLEYREDGTGDLVVFVHGGISDYRIWQVQREAIGKSYHAVSYSCRHCWPNTPAPPDIDQVVEDHAADLAALVKELGGGPAHLVGNSFGGLISLLTAIRSPELVRSLTLLEPFAAPLLMSIPPKPLELLKLGLKHPSTAVAMLLFGARGLGPTSAAFERGDLEKGLEIFTLAVLGKGGVAKMTDARKQQAKDNAEAFSAQLLRGVFPTPNPEAVRSITVPTLLLKGEESPALMGLLTDRVHDLLPQAECVEIPGASHDAHVDNPTAATEAILSFLNQQSTS